MQMCISAIGVWWNRNSCLKLWAEQKSSIIPDENPQGIIHVTVGNVNCFVCLWMLSK